MRAASAPVYPRWLYTAEYFLKLEETIICAQIASKEMVQLKSNNMGQTNYKTYTRFLYQKIIIAFIRPALWDYSPPKVDFLLS